MTYHIDIQNEINTLAFSVTDIETWVRAALSEITPHAELTIRFVSPQEMLTLNSQYRQKHSTTNVLSFPSDIPEEISQQLPLPYIGDIIICPEVLLSESKEQQKDLAFHWAHIIIHGVLHLLGYDHIEEFDTQKMQALEMTILQKLHFPAPYEND